MVSSPFQAGQNVTNDQISLLGYERVYLPLFKVADTPFHIQGDKLFVSDAHQFMK